MIIDELRHEFERKLRLPPLYSEGEIKPQKPEKVTEFIKTLEPRRKRTRSKKSPTLRERVELLEGRVAQLEEQLIKLPPQP